MPAAKERYSSEETTLLMLLALNFLLLAFFILLNSMATRQSSHSQAVLAKVREGYDIAGPKTDGGTLPWAPTDPWRDEVGRRVEGVLSNRLRLETIPLEVDGDKLVIKLPMGALFDDTGKVDGAVVRNFLSAAGAGSKLSWRVEGSLAGDPSLPARAAALALETGAVEMANGDNGVRIVFIPGEKTKPDVGGTLQRLGIDAGSESLQAEGADGQQQ